MKESFLRVVLLAALFLAAGCGGREPLIQEDVFPQKVKPIPYPEVANIEVTPYDDANGLNTLRIPLLVREVSPIYYDGNDTRLFRVQVRRAIYLPNGKLVIPKGSELFGRQNKDTGRYFVVTRYREAGLSSWTPAAGLAETGSEGDNSTAFLTYVAKPRR